jgi:molybdopterin-guanine dinucleotide biosynthesis protein B
VVAIASDTPLPDARVPVVDLDDIDHIVDILLEHATPVSDLTVARESA